MRFAHDTAVVLLVVLALPVVTAAVVTAAAWQRKGESATQTRPNA